MEKNTNQPCNRQFKAVERLMEKGVNIPNPESVYIADDVDLNRISGQGVTLFAGTKLIGARTLIHSNVMLGYEGSVTLENTMVGENTRLNGGYFQDAVFLGNNSFGLGAHVRKGTILEEEANAAHTVGLKQTILFPFVTLGSLINFCDCFMAGGTSRKDHSEVGSSFIHFNYTPNQDKATPSMMGNVHQGVMLNQPPIFLGGQGGIVGPLCIGFGCTSAAGSILRKDETRQNRLIIGGGMRNASLAKKPGMYTNISPIVNKNIAYISSLFALREWYTHIRPLFAADLLSKALIKGLQENLDSCIKERISRFAAFGKKLEISKSLLPKGDGETFTKADSVHERAMELVDKALLRFEEQGRVPLNHGAEKFIGAMEEEIKSRGNSYVSVIQGLDSETSAQGSEWLLGIENSIKDDLMIP